MSIISSWSEEESITDLETCNSAIEMLSRGKISPLKYQLQTPLSEVTPQSRNYIRRKATQVVHSLLQKFAPGQSDDLLKSIAMPEMTSQDQNSDLLNTMIKLYSESSHNVVKDQLLSLMAGLTTKEDLLKRIPGLTKYHVDKVRAVTPDELFMKENEPPKKRQRMDQCKLDHCLSFFFNSSFHQLVSYGTRDMQLDSGDTLTIPDVVRTACHASIIEMYEKHCRDTNFSPLSRSTLYKILSSCSASKRRNLHGLDNITADGLEAFKALNDIVKALEGRGVLDNSTKDRILHQLRDGQNYLKRNFKFHVLLDSSCADHCIRWACSDAKDIQFQSSCEHEHTDGCKDCNTITTLLEQICMLDLNEDEIVGVTDAKCSIESWKAHILRTINQDRGRTELLEGLNSHQILIVIDWAMKFLPLLHREKQSDWFGQKGISWHVAVGITKDLDGSLKVLCFIITPPTSFCQSRRSIDVT